MKHSIRLLLIVAITGLIGTGYAQTNDNPFKSIGKEAKVLTAYNGRFVEDFDCDTIQRLGSVMINIHTKKIVKMLDAEKIFTKYSNNSTSSRWYSVDPLAAKGKNISYSPYAFVTDNPMNYTDPDGKDGLRVIDDKNKTITIQAIYYVQTAPREYVENNKVKQEKGYSEKDIQTIQTKANEYLNKLGINVSEGEYKGYAVKFDLQFKGDGTVKQTEEDAKCTEGGNSLTLANGSNYAKFKEQTIDNGDGTETPRTVGGQTGDNKFITMNAREDTKINRIHEIFHTFGFEHAKDVGGAQGVMKYPPDKPTQTDINQLANSTFLPAVIVQ